MKTIIEIYDESPIANLSAAAVLKPERVIFIGGRRMSRPSVKSTITRFFSSIGLDTELLFFSMDISDFDSVLKRLHRIINKYPDCAIDLFGGRETIIAAAGMLSGEHDIPLFTWSPRTRKFVNVRNCESVDGISADIDLSIPQIVSMAGGLVTGHGHISDETITPDVEADVMNVWKTVKRYRSSWSEQTGFFQRANQIRYMNNAVSGDPSLSVGPAQIKLNKAGKNSRCNMNIMRALAADGIIDNIYVKDGSISFSYKNSLLKKCLSDAGIWLEMYGFITARRLGVFNDAQLSVTVDWNGDITEKYNTCNELDIVLTSGMKPIFISCKMSAPNVAAVNEIKTLAGQFGGKFSHAVILTMGDMANDAPFVLQRAMDSGVRIIDRKTIASGKLGDELLKLV
nr:DUF1887 family protein [Clostridia bacterium]